MSAQPPAQPSRRSRTTVGWGGLLEILSYEQHRPPLALAATAPWARVLCERAHGGVVTASLQVYYLCNSNNNAKNTSLSTSSSDKHGIGRKRRRSNSSPLPSPPPEPADPTDLYRSPLESEQEPLPAFPDELCGPFGVTRWVATRRELPARALQRIRWWLARPLLQRQQPRSAEASQADGDALVSGAQNPSVPPPMFGCLPLGLSLYSLEVPDLALDANMLPNIRAITIDHARLRDLTFMTSFTNGTLTHLHLSRCNAVTNLEFLRALPQLRSISLTDIGVSSLSPLAEHCPLLEAVSLWGCGKIESFDVLASLCRLAEVDLGMLSLTAIPAGEWRQLRVVRIARCSNLVNLQALTQHKDSLVSLLLDSLPLADLGFIPQCLKLEEIALLEPPESFAVHSLNSLHFLRDLHIEAPAVSAHMDAFTSAACGFASSLRALKLTRWNREQDWNRIDTAFPFLRALCISHNAALVQAPFLSRLTGLVDLELSSLPLTDVIPLTSLQGLRTVSLSSTRIRSILPITQGASAAVIEELRLDNCNQIPEDTPDPSASSPSLSAEWASLRNLTSIRILSVGHTNMDTVAWVSGCPRLHYLRARGCKIGDLSPLKNRKDVLLVMDR